MADPKIEKGLAEPEAPKTIESALRLPAQGRAPGKKLKKDTKNDPGDSFSHEYVSFPPFPGRADDETWEESRKEQASADAEPVEEIQREQPPMEVNSNEQESASEWKQRPRRASSLWFWNGR
ncbi:hypothetical protein BDP81DRAFT_454881 [Colletotrichum phormii]|uniref:Uncharacterized protein n=1 Tax=Colletotrichum phormii TaxID=359342 RepID=A0AAI9ZE44_9PEZI|nr:uncharacterized protein BDP81DRAFT_454881 [Colletotrichum phormii]KAK1622853.1 hypothetical protein BDP81DRAFT_454881 [Colletotrichum phormii]